MDLNTDLDSLKNRKMVPFKELLRIAIRHFGKPRIKGSHHVFKVPWQGKPWVNLQKEGKMSKKYQLKQMIDALERAIEMEKKNEK